MRKSIFVIAMAALVTLAAACSQAAPAAPTTAPAPKAAEPTKAAAPAAGATSAPAAQPGKKVTVGFSMPELQGSFWISMYYGVQDEAKKQGVDLVASTRAASTGSTSRSSRCRTSSSARLT